MKIKTLLTVFTLLIYSATFAQQPNRNGRIYLSTDSGVNWALADNGFPADDQVNAWIMKDQMIIAGTNAHGILVSSDKLNSWHSFTKGLPKKMPIISLALHKNILFAGTRESGIYSSYDEGETWKSCNVGLSNLTVRALASNGPVLVAGTNDGIFTSSDNGQTWVSEIAGLQINNFSLYQGAIFAATHKGLFVSQQFGKNWKSIFNLGAVHKTTVTEGKIYTLGYNGVVYQADVSQYIWLKSELFLPFDTTFRLTPASVQFFKARWKNFLRNTGVKNVNNGLPETMVFTELLNTPYGIIASAVSGTNGC